MVRPPGDRSRQVPETIRARMEELCRERHRTHTAESYLQSDPPIRRGRSHPVIISLRRLKNPGAICSDTELRAHALKRQHAYDEAKARLSTEQQRALLADQNRWARSYPQACRVAPDAPPSLPLATAIKDCMAQAGRARVAYLRAYGQTPPSASR
jgi:hypothetical protein